MGEISNGTRILLMEYLLKRLTDKDHALSREELISKVKSLGTNISSNTVKADIESIKSFNEIMATQQDILLNPFKGNSVNVIEYETKQKKGAYVKNSYYTDVELIILKKLLGKCLCLDKKNSSRLIEKVLINTSLYKINQYQLFNDLNNTTLKIDEQIFIDKVVNAINTGASLSIKQFDYIVSENKLKEVGSNKVTLVYPTNIDIIDNQIYIVGYCFNNGEKLELEYYRINNLCELNVVRTPKYIRKIMLPFIDKIWQTNDPLNISKGIIVNLQIRVYVVNSAKVFQQLKERFKNSAFIANQFNQFVDIVIENVSYDENLVSWFIEYANYIEVFKPLELRYEIKDRINEMNIMYSGKELI